MTGRVLFIFIFVAFSFRLPISKKIQFFTKQIKLN